MNCFIGISGRPTKLAAARVKETLVKKLLASDNKRLDVHNTQKFKQIVALEYPAFGSTSPLFD